MICDLDSSDMEGMSDIFYILYDRKMIAHAFMEDCVKIFHSFLRFTNHNLRKMQNPGL